MRGNLPIMPVEANIQPVEVRDWMQNTQNDLYPRIQVYTPVISGLTAHPGPIVISGGSNRIIGPIWVISAVIRGGSIASGAYFDLPFNLTVSTIFQVRLSDGTTLSAFCDTNTKRVSLPDWTTTGTVVINGMVGG